MIHCACVLNLCNDFPAFAIEQTAHSMCVCLYICARMSHKKKDTRIKSALLFSNELRSPAVSFSDATDGTFIQSDLQMKETKFYFEDKLMPFKLAIPVSVADLRPE